MFNIKIAFTIIKYYYRDIWEIILVCTSHDNDWQKTAGVIKN